MTHRPDVPERDAVLWSAPTSWVADDAYPGDDEHWDRSSPVRAEHLALSGADRAWLDRWHGYWSMSFTGVSPQDVGEVLGAVAGQDVNEGNPGRDMGDGVLSPKDMVALWRDDVLAVIDTLPPGATASQTDGAIVEYAGALAYNGQVWAVAEAEFDDLAARRDAIEALSGHDHVRVLDLPGGAMPVGLLHPYPRFDDHAIAIVLAAQVMVEDVPWLFGQYVGPPWDAPPTEPGQESVAGPARGGGRDSATGQVLYLAAEEGTKGRVFAAERNTAGRTVLRPVLRCETLRLAMRLADLLTEATQVVDPNSGVACGVDLDVVLAYAEEHLRHGSIVAVRGELGLTTNGFVGTGDPAGRRSLHPAPAVPSN